MNLSDQAILKRWISRRDAEAFRAIVQRHAGMVYATCRRILRNDSDAEDVAQECFETLVTTTGREQPRQLGPWLHGVATKKCLMRLRAEGRRRQREAEYAAGQANSAEPQWNDIYSYVDEAIAELPEETRSSVVAHFLYGQSHAEIARATGVPRRTVSNRVKKGLELIGESLRKRGIPVATSALTVMMAAQLTAEAAPAALTAALGKLALAHSANGTAAISASGAAAKVVGGVLTVKKAVVAVVAIGAVVGGLRLAQHAKHDVGIESRAELTPSRESVSSDVAPVVDEPGPQPALPPAENYQSSHESVSGTVKFYGTEEPAPGVVVKLWCQNKWVDETVTDENGSYRLVGLMPGLKYLLRARSEAGYTAFHGDREVRLDEGESRSGVDFILATKGVISGKVTDKSVTYHPSRLATVEVKTYVSERALREDLERELVSVADKPLHGVKIVLAAPGRRWETTSDENGQYTFGALAPGAYEVSAEMPEGAVMLPDSQHYRSQRVSIGPNEHKTDIDFSFRLDAVSITGRVTDSTGDPIEGAEVVAEHLVKFETDAHPGSVATASDVQGRYRLDGLFPVHIHEASVYLTHGSLPKLGTFRVRACAWGFNPAQTIVPAIHENLVRDALSCIEWGFREGLYNGDQLTHAEVALPTSHNRVISGVDFVLTGGAVVSGRLVDTRGNVVPESVIRMVFEDPSAEVPLAVEDVAPDPTETDGEGQFTFECVPSGVFLFETDNRAGGSQKARNAPLSVREGEFISDIKVVVEAVEEKEKGNISGLVVDGTFRQPIQGFFVYVIGLDAPGETSPVWGRTILDDSREGAFLIEGISPGTATLQLSAPGYAPERVQVGVVSGRTREMTFSLTAEGVLLGCVTENGEAKEGVSVTAFPAEEGGGRSAYTSGEGYYELQELKEGKYLVSASARWGIKPRVVTYGSVWADVESGRTTRVDLELGGSAAIYGTLSYPDEGVRGYIFVRDASATGAVPPIDSRYYYEQIVATALFVQRNGYYEIGNLPPGTYNVTARYHFFDQKAGTFIPVNEQSKIVSLSGGDIAEANFDLH